MKHNLKEAGDKIRIIPFGGCGEFGMNLTLYIYHKQVFVVDAGLLFPEPWQLGVSAVVPHVDECFKKFGKPRAYILTHGHEDHIGAMPHLLRKWPADIFCTRWTTTLLERKLDERGITGNITTVAAGDKVNFGSFSFEYFAVNHSIPHACSLIVRSKSSTVFHTGDFKIEKNPIDGCHVDLGYLKKVGRNENVKLIVADSTNSHKPGVCPDELSVFKPLKRIIRRLKVVFLSQPLQVILAFENIADICASLNKNSF